MDDTNGKTISREEQEIWDELECDIEKNLEQEIMDSLSILACRLQILYQKKKKRSNINEEAAPDLSIVIKLGIGRGIEIKVGNSDNDRSRPYTPCSEESKLRLEKACVPNSHSMSQFGASKASMTTSKCESTSCASTPLQKAGKNRKVVWKY